MAYVHIYDGETQLSEGTELTPLVVGPLNATNNEVSAAKALIAKTQTGYTTYGDTVLSFQGATADKWSLCATADGTYASTLTISTAITDAGTTFYVKAASSSDEDPINDITVDIHTAAVVAAV